ncbi:MAG: class I SAM-dependent methyltransferase, partial [Proteobacteria bacterium]|nr:class I SAM-dependent methyltransferase [Pseudomonadota bacterium]
MVTVKQHYEEFLSEIYSWMAGGFNQGIEENTAFFSKHKVQPAQPGIAVDLGCGCGFQSIPLARTGFNVVSLDTDKRLLDELQRNAFGLDIKVVNDDLLNFAEHLSEKAEIIVCMTDTILHLNSAKDVISLFNKTAECLSEGGKFIITCRDFSNELFGVDRIIPVKSDDSRILTCFLEYTKNKIIVNDILYQKNKEK